MTELHDYLRGLAPGPILDARHLERLLSGVWHEFEGSDAEGMAGFKLYDRMEEVVWEPPVLQFTIERHGATVLGSSRADRHRWTLDLNTMRAACGRVGYKQLRPTNPPMNVRKIAEEVFRLMDNHQDDDRLKWSEDGRVQVLIGQVIPAQSVPQQTVTGQRKRFRQKLDELVQHAGGQILRPNVYRFPRS